METQNEDEKLFEKYSSKAKTIYIPTPGFFYSDTYGTIKKRGRKRTRIIGRKEEIFRLKDKLINTQSKNGAYLITGYRGMGKTCFVNEVINRIKRNSCPIENALIYLYFVLVSLCMFIFIEGNKMFPLYSEIETKIVLLYLVITPIILLLVYKLSCIFKRVFMQIEDVDFHLFNFLKKICNEITNPERKNNRLIIHLNVGKDILQDRDILYLIAKNIETEFNHYVNDIGAHWFKSLIKFSLSCSLASLLFITYLGQNYWLVDHLQVFIRNEHVFNFIWFIVFFLLSYYLINNALVCMIGFFNMSFSTSGVIKKDLKKLNEHIESSIVKEKNTYISTPSASSGLIGTLSANVNSSKKNSYDLANVREIELELINILNKMDKGFPLYFSTCSVIVVFDELDKISPDSKDEKDDIFPEFDSSVSGFSNGGTSRKKKEETLKLLASLKYFISTAKAKFIFVAGRELYDAYLADVSDREFAISSIFNDVIYIKSFLSGSDSTKNITSMMEEYICIRLIPYDYIYKNRRYKRRKSCVISEDVYPTKNSLKTYYKYLALAAEKVAKAEAAVKVAKADVEEKERAAIEEAKKRKVAAIKAKVKVLKAKIKLVKAEAKVLKTAKAAAIEEVEYRIQFLYNFILYLTYMSNGSPKKIATYFERYIITEEQYTKENESRLYDSSEKKKNFFRSEKKHNYYLKFDIKAQQEINFIHYIAYPLTTAVIERAGNFGDKLLISALFLINHIYKYHNAGFSWRNMEYTPELLELNRTPELRDFIDSILGFLKHTHLAPIVSNLFGYKFSSSIAEEISMLSKSSEVISATFNFTLDESHCVKHYYYDLLKYYSKHENKNNTHVIAGIHHVLGDLHLADEEYPEAIYEYQESISCFTDELKELSSNDSHYTTHILLLTRTMLKLGLAFEKKKTYSSAYITYRELVSKLIEYRWFTEDSLALKHEVSEGAYHLSPNSSRYHHYNKYDIKWEESIVGESPFEISELALKLSEQLNPDTTILMTKLALFEDVRFPYQALLAKLFVLEKMELGGISKKNIDVVKAEFKYLLRTANIEDKYLIHADFYRKIGDILFYKNGIIGKYPELNAFLYWGYDGDKDTRLSELTSDEKQSLINKISACKKRRELIMDRNHQPPCYACSYYNKALKILMKQILLDTEGGYPDSSVSKAYMILASLSKNKSAFFMKENDLSLLASTSDCMGNVLISCSSKTDYVKVDFINYFFSQIESLNIIKKLENKDKIESEKNEKGGWSNGHPTISNPLERSILYFWAAAEAYRDASKLSEASLCYKKILSILIEYISNIKIESAKSKKSIKAIGKNIDNKNIRKYIVNRVIQCLYSNYEHTNTAEIQSIKWILSKEIYEPISLNKLSLFPDIQEIICMYKELEIKYLICKNKINCVLYNKLYKSPLFINTLNCTIYQQIVSFRLKALINRDVFLNIMNSDCNVNKNDFLRKIYLEDKRLSFFYTSLSGLLNRNYRKTKLLKKIFENNTGTILDYIEFLIVDSIYCLMKIVELITPFPKTTLFTHSYIASLYYQLFEWNQAFEFLYIAYQYIDASNSLDNDKKKCIEKRLLNIQKELTADEMYQFSEKSRVINKINKLKTNADTSNDVSKKFFKKLIDTIGENNIHYTISNYQAEMAIKEFTRAKEMNSQGSAYKEMIDSFYYLDDDLNNESYKFYLSLERYRINCEYIDEPMDALKKLYWNSDLYNPEKYIGPSADRYSANPIFKKKY